MGCDAVAEFRDGIQGRTLRTLVSPAPSLLYNDTNAHRYDPYSAYAAGATVQIVLFSMNAAKVKLNAPRAQTFLEIIRARWGNVAHIVFMFYALITSLLVSSMLVTVSDRRGLNLTEALLTVLATGWSGGRDRPYGRQPIRD